MEFEKLLKESSLRVQWTETGETEMPMLFDGGRSAIIKTGAKVIPLEDLGKWHLEEYKLWMKNAIETEKQRGQCDLSQSYRFYAHRCKFKAEDIFGEEKVKEMLKEKST